MDLRRSLDEVLQVCPKRYRESSVIPCPRSAEENTSPGQEVTQVDKFTVLLIFDIDHTPLVFSPTDALPVNYDRALGANDCEGNHRL